VLLLERDLSQPDRIVGELLQPGGYMQLKKLGLAHCVQEIDAQEVRRRQAPSATRLQPPRSPRAHSPVARRRAPRRRPPAPQVYGYALFKDRREAVVAYPMEGLAKDVAGRSFHHGRFVQRMRHAAATCANVTAREGFVKRLVNGGPPLPPAYRL
jgi:squalene monooxygenase